MFEDVVKFEEVILEMPVEFLQVGDMLYPHYDRISFMMKHGDKCRLLEFESYGKDSEVQLKTKKVLVRRLIPSPSLYRVSVVQ